MASEENELLITPGERKRIFVVLFLAIMVTMIGVGNIAPFMPIYARELGASGLMVGMIFGGFSLMRLVTMPIFGRWSDRTSRKIFIAVGFLFYTLASVLFIFAKSAPQLMMVRMMQGASAAMILPIAMAYVGEISKVDHEARSMNSINIALFVGFGLGPLSGGIIHDSLGMHANFIALGAAAIVAFFLVVFFLPNIQVRNFLPEESRSKGASRYRDVLKSRNLRGIFLYRLSNALGRGALMSFLPLLASEKLGISNRQIGIIISINLLVSGLLQTQFSKVADKVNRVKMAAIGNIIAFISLMLIPFSHDVYQLLAFNLLMGIGGAVALPATSGLVVTEGRPYTMGTVMALFNIAMSIGLASGPILGGLIRDTSNVNNVFYFAGMCTLLGTGLFLYYLRGYVPNGQKAPS